MLFVARENGQACRSKATLRDAALTDGFAWPVIAAGPGISGVRLVIQA